MQYFYPINKRLVVLLCRVNHSYSDFWTFGKRARAKQIFLVRASFRRRSRYTAFLENSLIYFLLFDALFYRNG